MKKISNEYRSKYVLMTYYVKYLKKVRNVSNSTVEHYQQALQYISKFLVDRGKIKQSIYEIQNIDDLEILKEYVYLDPDFIELDTRGHRMYSAGLNNYIRFANGKGFENFIIICKLWMLKFPWQINILWLRIHGEDRQ